ncbi:hypothetical protein [Periweissella ghanensis]|uniref:YolD-like family protein n=1 Tax=Periweissella ghanensis TaxID=467997 RepID=A0ABM8ZEY5_9LACO|nr:hypothetical protein [Periweissella ghanensis]MCM0601432.1 hypothetical protein [Periweissella ghanensis]CAH0419487.1 hypothetical protein WGH24286_01946 [Periweissella ghanensis]
MQMPFNFINHASEPQVTTKLNFFKPTTKHAKVTRERQMHAEEIITRLEAALDARLDITIQFNVSFYTENVYQLSGYLTLSNNEQLILHSHDYKVSTIVWPTSIRYIAFNN